MISRKGKARRGSNRSGGATVEGGPAAVGGSGELRIIGGRWRGRHWHFPAGVPIRPTPDRVRETLFNWLMHDIVGAHCVDAFAGSGALGLEALSRGAAEVRFLETDRAAAQAIRERLQDWDGKGATVTERDALAWLEGAAVEPVDLVFLDPPFGAGLLPRAIAALHSRGWLRGAAHVYIESSATASLPPLPVGWVVHRSGRAGEVGYHLLRCRAANDSPRAGGQLE